MRKNLLFRCFGTMSNLMYDHDARHITKRIANEGDKQALMAMLTLGLDYGKSYTLIYWSSVLSHPKQALAVFLNGRAKFSDPKQAQQYAMFKQWFSIPDHVRYAGLILSQLDVINNEISTKAFRMHHHHNKTGSSHIISPDKQYRDFVFKCSARGLVQLADTPDQRMETSSHHKLIEQAITYLTDKDLSHVRVSDDNHLVTVFNIMADRKQQALSQTPNLMARALTRLRGMLPRRKLAA